MNNGEWARECGDFLYVGPHSSVSTVHPTAHLHLRYANCQSVLTVRDPRTDNTTGTGVHRSAAFPLHPPAPAPAPGRYFAVKVVSVNNDAFITLQKN